MRAKFARLRSLAFAAALCLGVVGGCAPEARQSEPSKKVEVISSQTESKPNPPGPERTPETEVEYAKDNHNEDPTDAPNASLGANSAIGLSGGGGGTGGTGGFQYRRARGGGGRGGVEAGDLNAGDELWIMSGGEKLKPAEVKAASPENVTEGSLFAKRGSETVGQFPLKHTDVKAEISGYLGATSVTQTFTNPFNEVIEAVYTFPLPNNAAINDFLMVIGERRIRGMVRPRAEAEQIYQEARSRGVTASLLTQERPNIFTQNVANIAVGGSIDIQITYFETLKYEDGRYEYTFPMVVAPRYIGGNPKTPAEVPTEGQKETPVGGQGTVAPTDRVKDAEKITPPLVPAETRSGHDISLTLDVDAGLPLDFSKLEAVTHKMHSERVSNTRFVAKLDDLDNIPNRDFVYRWTLSVEKPTVGLLTHRDQNGGFFTLMLQPQLHPADADVTPREITFLIDTSGSQHGKPLQMSQDITIKALDGMRPEDTFNVFYFAGGNGQLWDAPKPRTSENVKAAKDYVKSLRGGGGTEMLAGLKRALAAKHDPKFLQMYAFFTDGQIGSEEEILNTIKNEKNGARFFCFGTGGSVNRYLCDGISEFGDGRTIYCVPRDQNPTEKATELFFQSIDAPVLCDISIDYNGLPMTDIYPARVKDLFAGQPIMLKGRYTKAAKGTIFVNGRIGARQVSIPVEVSLPEKEDRNECLAPIWARARIAELSGEMLGKSAEDQKPIIQQITNLAVEFRLMSQYTAFVAVDESRIVGDGKPLKVMQPVELPEGMSREHVEGGPGAKPMEIPAWGMTVMQNKQGGVAIILVNKGGAADKAGVVTGKLIASIDGVAVTGAAHLEGLLLQTSGKETSVGLIDAGADVKAIAAVKLPRP